MGSEATIVCVDTSVTCPDSLCWFHDQIDAVKIYCERKLRAHPNNLVGIVTFGNLDYGTHLAPTNGLTTVSSKLSLLEAREQASAVLLHGFWYSHISWPGHKDMKRRIVVFSGGPLFFTRDEFPEAIDILKEDHVVLDVVDFGIRPKGHDEYKTNLKALVNAMNDYYNNNENRYFTFQDDGFSLSHHISSSPILPSPHADVEEAKLHPDAAR